MNKKNIYACYSYLARFIGHAVYLYCRFNLSFRDIEQLLAICGINVGYENIRLWCSKFGATFLQRLKQRRGYLGDIWYLDEVFKKINGKLHYFWRVIDQDGDELDILVQKRLDKKAAKNFFKVTKRSIG